MSANVQTPSRSTFPVIVAILGAFLLFFYLTSKVYVDRDTVEIPANAVEVESLAEHDGAARAVLAETKVVDAGKGQVRLDIERAKALVLAEESK